jgi:hypothetical protein
MQSSIRDCTCEGIVVSEDIHYGKINVDAISSDLHDCTCGIASDALAQFVVAFSKTPIHDANHRGIPNPQLAKKMLALGEKYKQTSIAEQNSVDLVWDLLMNPHFTRTCSSVFLQMRRR